MGIRGLGHLVGKLGVKKTIAIVLILGLLGSLGWLGWKHFHHPNTGNPYDYLTMNQAAKMGDMKDYKLMIKITKPKNNKENFQRGDIVLIMPGDHKFSPAEKSGFLIIKMKLTKKQTELLTQSLDKIKREKDKETGQPKRETLARRKFSVDLAKIGIPDNVQRGREINDKTFDWKDVVVKKK